MERRRAQVQAVGKREPLGDATKRVNANPPSRRTKGLPSTSSASSMHKLPHHESLMPNAPHNVRTVAISTVNDRVPVSRVEAESKRESEVSTTSTNATGTGRRRKTHIGPWQLGSDVGKGGCGKVRKVRHCLTGEVAAVKIISKRVAEKERAESLVSLVERTKRAGGSISTVGTYLMPFGIEREVVIMKLLVHRNVVQLLDVWENRDELYLVMEYVNGGELLDHIERCEYLDEDETVWIFRQTLAALLHCHRLGIHHRDLKPENILLQITPEQTIEVKLVDFGMAALQPRGKLLTTPCGSVHYAAPEVFEKCYDGNKVDVWSLGVILYVMLLGRTPFNMPSTDTIYDSTVWCALIKSGRYDLPEHLSSDAKDLVRKMLVPDPKKRVNLEAVWHHPLLHKYEVEWGESSEANKLENWIGQAQRVGTWTVKERKDVDREILRNLRTLWHSEKEDVIVSRLLSDEVNKEKEFYVALLKHREDQLENYVGTPESFAQSSSDYHHASKLPIELPLPRLPATAYDRSRSQYSVLNEEKTASNKRQSQQSLPSVRSYDPFRASRIPMPAGKEAHTGYTVHRVDSTRSVRNAKKPAKPLGPRVEALRDEERRYSTSTAVSTPDLRSKTFSRSSMLSLAQSTSSRISGPVRPNIGYKRGVSFSHLHRSSTASVTSAKTTSTKSRPTTLTADKGTIAQVRADNSLGSPGSSAALAAQVVVHRKRKPVKKQPAHPHSQSYCHLINSEARKVSTELENICDEAFKYSDMSSRTSAATSQALCETPPSSISNRGSGRSYEFPRSGKLQEESALDSSPLPASSSETPSTFIARELAETRKRLAERYTKDRSAHTSTYSEVLAHLDALLEPAVLKPSTNDVRPKPSALEQRYVGHSYLPAISEENKSFDGEDANADGMNAAGQKTIRYIDPTSPPAALAPLIIRKTSAAGSRNCGLRDEPANTSFRADTPASSRFANPMLNSPSADMAATQLRITPVPKKKGWFGRKNAGELEKAVLPSSPRAWEDLDDRIKPSEATNATKYHHKSHALQHEDNDVTALPVSKKKPSLLRFWTKGVAKTKEYPMAVGAQDDDTERSTTAMSMSTEATSAAAMRNGLHPTDLEPRDLGVQRSWLSRFLNIKPATSTICFQAGRGVVRHKLMRLLRASGAVGMRDVELDRERNLIFARLDSNNAYGLKEVSFVAQLYIVLVNGRRAQLCLARFTQRRGAASSFRKIMVKVEEVLGEWGLTVQSTEKKRDMMAMLEGV